VHISFSYAVIIDKNLSIDAVHAGIPSLFCDRHFRYRHETTTYGNLFLLVLLLLSLGLGTLLTDTDVAGL
jgi:hypothetical protein